MVGDREIVWSTTLGTCDTVNKEKVNTETIFSIQSMSKSITALAVLIAGQDGLVNLDAPISTYLPDFKVNSRFEAHPEQLITLRHLLSHCSGLVHEALFGNNDDREFNWNKHIESTSRTWLLFTVGYCCSYSNCGLDLAAHILEKVSGKTFPQYLREKVFDPLGMYHTYADFDVIEKVSNRTTGHGYTPGPMPLKFSMTGAGGGFGFFSVMQICPDQKFGIILLTNSVPKNMSGNTMGMQTEEKYFQEK